MGAIRNGVHPFLEAAANEILRQSLVGVTKYSEKSDILTPWKEQDRRNREVYVESGVPDAATRKGMYHRRYNPAMPHLNSRDCVSSRTSRTSKRESVSHGPGHADYDDD